jgi:TRAP-type C4-dicarboxylate transport system permease small subunit
MKLAALIAAWTLSILGGMLAVLCALLFLFGMSQGGFGIVIAVYCAVPAGLVGIAIFALGQYFDNLAHKLNAQENSTQSHPPCSPTDLLPAKKELS